MITFFSQCNNIHPDLVFISVFLLTNLSLAVFKAFPRLPKFALPSLCTTAHLWRPELSAHSLFLEHVHASFRGGFQLQPTAHSTTALYAKHCLLFFLVEWKRKYLEWVKCLGHGGPHSQIKSSPTSSISADPEQPTSADSSAASSHSIQWQTDHRKLLSMSVCPTPPPCTLLFHFATFCQLLSSHWLLPPIWFVFSLFLMFTLRLVCYFYMSNPLFLLSCVDLCPIALMFGTWVSLSSPHSSLKHLSHSLIQSDVSSLSFSGVYQEFSVRH